LVKFLGFSVLELQSFEFHTVPTSYVNMLEENEVNIGTEPLDDFDADNNVGESEMGVEVYPPPLVDIERVSSLGYGCLGEAGVPGRLYFRRRGPPNFNLHLVKMEGPIWQNNIRLREYLAASPDARARYSAIKLQAVQNGATQLLAYSAAKSGIVDELLREAALRFNASLAGTRDR
jgi:GrpB-like predicted nucleotidyltransferase (UPF0157 family)